MEVTRLLDRVVDVDQLGEHLREQQPALVQVALEEAAVLRRLHHLRRRVRLDEHGADVLELRVQRQLHLLALPALPCSQMRGVVLRDEVGVAALVLVRGERRRPLGEVALVVVDALLVPLQRKRRVATDELQQRVRLHRVRPSEPIAARVCASSIAPCAARSAASGSVGSSSWINASCRLSPDGRGPSRHRPPSPSPLAPAPSAARPSAPGESMSSFVRTERGCTAGRRRA